MARKNAACVELLALAPADAVLEIGFGLGRTLAAIAERAPSGFVAGVHPSRETLRMASARNRAAIESGRMQLARGSAETLPLPDLLRPGGTLLLGIRLRAANEGRFASPGFSEAQAEALGARSSAPPSRFGASGARLDHARCWGSSRRRHERGTSSRSRALGWIIRSRPRPEILVPLRPCSRAALLALASSFALSACGGAPAPEIKTAKAETAQIERIVVATGTIEPAKEVEVRPRIPGIIDRILVNDGEHVVAGQVLVEIERELLEAQAQEAAAELDAAKVERHYAQIDLARARELEQSGAVSSQKLDEARARSENASAGVARAEAKLRTLRTQLSYARVTSPLAGRVLDIPVEEGQAVSPVTAVTGGTLLLSLAATTGIHLEGLVDENEVARVALGQKARIRTEAYGDRVFAGEVIEIAPVGQRNQNVTYFEVKVAVTDPDASLLRPRMSGDAEIVAETVEGALVVPETALRYRGKEIFVEVPNGEALDEHIVETGIIDGARVQIVKGLSAGDVVKLQ